jgi:hypothetical protein
MDPYEIPMIWSSDDEPADDDIIPALSQEVPITKLGGNLPNLSQSDMPGILSAFAMLLFRN